MKYDVYIDDIFIYGVENEDFISERDTHKYNGLKSGNFVLPADRALKTWNIKAELTEVNDFKHSRWSPASSIFSKLDALLESEQESRLVIYSAYNSVSERVLLEGYKPKEVDNGIFEVSISLIEYVDVGIKTTDIPYIERPGKIPAPPKTFVAKDDSSGFELGKTMSDYWKKYGEEYVAYNEKMMPVRNPAVQVRKGNVVPVSPNGVTKNPQGKEKVRDVAGIAYSFAYSGLFDPQLRSFSEVYAEWQRMHPTERDSDDVRRQ